MNDGFFEKINKINKPLLRLTTKKKREDSSLLKPRMKQGTSLQKKSGIHASIGFEKLVLKYI